MVCCNVIMRRGICAVYRKQVSFRLLFIQLSSDLILALSACFACARRTMKKDKYADSSGTCLCIPSSSCCRVQFNSSNTQDRVRLERRRAFVATEQCLVKVNVLSDGSNCRLSVNVSNRALTCTVGYCW
jgi:hypothetical protein